METAVITKILSRMSGDLLPEQLNKLEGILEEVLNDTKSSEYSPKNNRNLVNQFISAKKIEGCSKRTEEYYSSVLKFYEKSINCNICDVDTTKIRDYLINYQKINNCSNVTLDTIRRILSSFYKWLEEEDFIIKSPMKRIHKIKTPTVLKPALSEEQIEVIRKTAAENSRNIAIIDILLSSGIRVSELVRLNRNSINLNSRTCIVLGKGAKQRDCDKKTA